MLYSISARVTRSARVIPLLFLGLSLRAGVTYTVGDAIYPAGSHYFSVKAYGAVGDGIHDDTPNIRAAIAAARADGTSFGTDQTIYFPAGAYLVSDTLWWNTGQSATSTAWFSGLRFEGQNKSNTTIKLKDNTFTNSSCTIGGSVAASAMCRGVIYTANNGQTNNNGSGESAYKNDIWNLTINTGSGNPGAVGIHYQCSNRCEVKNVNVVSGDRQGKAGIDISISLGGGTGQGPGFLKNISVHGFDYAFYANSPAGEVSLNYEYIDIDGQNVAGFYNAGHSSWVRNLGSVNAVPVFINGSSSGSFGAAHGCTKNSGKLLVVDAVLTGTGAASNTSAVLIENNQAHQGTTFLRNITTTGYQSALATGTTATVVSGSSITEFTFPAGITQFGNPLMSLNLQNIPNTPEIFDNNFGTGGIDANGFSTADCTNMGPSAINPGDWADVTCYGANRTSGGASNNAAAIQSALNSGRPVIYFPWGNYQLQGTLHIPNTVRKIMGMHSFIKSTVSPTFSCENTTSNSVEIRLFSMAIGASPVFSNSCKGPFVIANVGQNAAGYRDVTSGNTVFFEDYAGPYPLTFNNSTVYARQFDIEGGYPTFTNSTGWIFGYKTEAGTSCNGAANACTLLTASGGSLEILGAQHFLNTNTGETRPEYSISNTEFSVESFYSATGWNPTISETKSGVTRPYYAEGTGFGGCCESIGLYSGHVAIGPPPPPLPQPFVIQGAVVKGVTTQ